VSRRALGRSPARRRRRAKPSTRSIRNECHPGAYCQIFGNNPSAAVHGRHRRLRPAGLSLTFRTPAARDRLPEPGPDPAGRPRSPVPAVGQGDLDQTDHDARGDRRPGPCRPRRTHPASHYPDSDTIGEAPAAAAGGGAGRRGGRHVWRASPVREWPQSGRTQRPASSHSPLRQMRLTARRFSMHRREHRADGAGGRILGQ
jgi:hypothetical protein